MMRILDADVAGLLAIHGLSPREDGYNLLDLERFLSARGWQWSIESVSDRPGSRRPTTRFRAMVMTSGNTGATQRRGEHVLGLRHTRGNGASETAALALALARMLGATSEHDP